MVRDHGERMDVAEFACMIVELGLTPRPMTPWVIKKVFRDANNGNLADGGQGALLRVIMVL